MAAKLERSWKQCLILVIYIGWLVTLVGWLHWSVGYIGRLVTLVGWYMSSCLFYYLTNVLLLFTVALISVLLLTSTKYRTWSSCMLCWTLVVPGLLVQPHFIIVSTSGSAKATAGATNTRTSVNVK